MNEQDLEDINAAFVDASVRAKSLSADGIELHSAHAYLLDQFLWAETNHRQDKYGGATLADRARYPAEVVAAIRNAVGNDFVINYRLSQFKEVDYTATLTENPLELAALTATLRRAGVDMRSCLVATLQQAGMASKRVSPSWNCRLGKVHDRRCSHYNWKRRSAYR